MKIIWSRFLRASGLRAPAYRLRSPLTLSHQGRGSAKHSVARWGLVIGLALVGRGLESPAVVAKDTDYVAERNRMVDQEIVAAGVKDPRVIRSMRQTPRHEFVVSGSRANAYYDMALPIGNGQTISPPFVVAYMTEQLLPQAGDKVLEVGTGSGYQAAILSPLVKDVYTIEIVKPLGERATRTLKRLKYANVHTKIGDGYEGWPENAPFDKIIVTCSPEEVPPKLVAQLREGGRMVVPVGERYQQTLYLFQKQNGELKKVALLPTLFVPMTGDAEAGRLIKPDPLHPTIHNGSFEELTPAGKKSASQEESDNPENASQTPTAGKREPSPNVWYYQRQLQLVEAKDAPQGSRYATFTNSEAGRGAHALQGMAVDGRKVSELAVTLWVKAKNVRQGTSEDQLPQLAITFYDENRVQCGYTFVGMWRDSFSWQKVVDKVRVPRKAREAILRIGLNGATGEVSFDDIHIQAADEP